MAWARMKIKPTKSRSLSLRRGVQNDSTTFVVGGEKIPLLSEQPIRSLGRQYNAELLDKRMGRSVMKQLSEAEGLAKIRSCTWEVQGLVLSVQALQEGDVTAENE